MSRTAITENQPEDGKRITVSGSVETVIYRSDRTDYCVIEMITEQGERITAVGNMPYVAEGENAVLSGFWTRHAEYGRQFSAESYEKKLPAGAAAILKYLSSKTIKGVGPATAIKIVERYGDDTFDIIENHPDFLTDVPGISPRRAREIHDSFCEQTGIRSLMMFCHDIFGSALVTRIYKQWGSRAVGILQENPYRLCRDVYGIGFERADALAATLGIAREADERLLSGIEYLLHYNAAGNGHCCMPQDKLIAAATAQLSVGEELIAAALERGLSSGILRKASYEGTEYWYARDLYEAEAYLARRLPEIDRLCPAFDLTDIDRMIEKTEAESGIVYAAMQRRALYEALRSGVLVLTGGPGTGKTTIIKALLRIFKSMGMRVALAAPTGRAAKRMSEATSAEAKTLHRLLETVRSEGAEPTFGRDETNPMEEDVILLDETSMMDLLLAAAFLRAVKRGARVIFVGDADQLPSVGAGNVLEDMIASGELNTVRLEQIFRQSEESLIVLNAHRINAGEMPELAATDKDFFYLPRPEHAIADTVADLLSRRLPRAYGKEILEQTQVITPSRKGGSGTEQLNARLQSVLNPPSVEKRELSFRGHIFRVGDRVMQIRNNYAAEWVENETDIEGIFNGDIGIVEEISEDGEFMKVRYDNQRLALYDKSGFEDLEHAYAVTVHKSQGSEYGTVILPLYGCPPMLLTRNLLYTAITRARLRVILVGRGDILARMVENDRHFLRYTLLAPRLRGLLGTEEGKK